MADDPSQRVAAAVEAAREHLEIAAALLRGDEIPASARAMRAEQQVTRALGALWGIEI